MSSARCSHPSRRQRRRTRSPICGPAQFDMTSTSEKPREESLFWRFSLRFYSRPSVAAACLALQDEAGADVNLMLFLLFLAEHKRQVTREDIARLDSTVRRWRDCVVKPL